MKKKGVNVSNKTRQNIINFDDVTKENLKEHNLNWPQFPDHPYRTLIIGGSGSRKTIHYLI